MRNFLDIKKLSKLLLLSSILTLLVLSPCKVRNLVEVQLGVPTTEVPNKYKATQNSVNCVSYGTTEIVEAVASTNKLYLPFLGVIAKSFYSIVVELPAKLNTPYTKRNEFVSLIPYYILYQNIQVYL